MSMNIEKQFEEVKAVRLSIKHTFEHLKITKHEVYETYMKYINLGWDVLKPIATYDESLADDNPYEGKLNKVALPVFPYDLKELCE